MIGIDSSDDLVNAKRLHQLGCYVDAENIYKKILEISPHNREVLNLYAVLRRQTADMPSSPWQIIWQIDPAKIWEEGWLRYLLEEIQGQHVFDGQHRAISQNMIVIENHLLPEHEAYYAKACSQGCKIVLIHLSDEVYRDDCSCYDWCDFIFRNYWSFFYKNKTNLQTFPLGYKTNFPTTLLPKSANERRYLWSFAGNPRKTTRLLMLQEMGKIAGGTTYLTKEFNDPAALSVTEYRALMDDTIFVPSPIGEANIESFRVWESLEAGCIPIVETRPNFDYYKILCPDHPFPTIANWSEAAAICNQSPLEVERLRMACVVWWRKYKTELKAKMTATIFDIAST